MTKNKIVSMEQRKDRARRYTGYHCTLGSGQSVNAWVSSDELDLEFHGINLKVACKLAVERASDNELQSGEVVVARAHLIEVEQRERAGGR